MKSFPSYKAHRTAQIIFSLIFNQTPVYTVRPWILGQCITRYACLRFSFAGNHYGRMARLGWPGWSVKCGDADGHPSK